MLRAIGDVERITNRLKACISPDDRRHRWIRVRPTREARCDGVGQYFCAQLSGVVGDFLFPHFTLRRDFSRPFARYGQVLAKLLKTNLKPPRTSPCNSDAIPMRWACRDASQSIFLAGFRLKLPQIQANHARQH